MSPISSMVFLASLWRFERSDHSKRGPGTEASVLAPLTRVRSCQDLRRHLWILSPIQTGNRGPPNPTPDDFTQLFDDWSRLRSSPDHYRLSAICQRPTRCERDSTRQKLGASTHPYNDGPPGTEPDPALVRACPFVSVGRGFAASSLVTRRWRNVIPFRRLPLIRIPVPGGCRQCKGASDETSSSPSRREASHVAGCLRTSPSPCRRDRLRGGRTL